MSMIRKFMAIGKSFSYEMNKNNVSAHASSAAFFLFLSIIPILLLICAIIPFTPVTEADLMTAVTDFLPSVLDPVGLTMIEEMYGKSPAVISVAAIMTIWSAAKGILSIMRALNAINGVVETRSYFVLRFKACIYTVVLLITVIVSLTIMVFGNVLVQLVITDVPKTKYIFKAFMHFRFLFSPIILVLLFSLLFTWIPNRSFKYRMQLPGAIFSALVWSAFSWGFSLYIDQFDGFNMYGSLTTIVIIMLWLYSCMYIMMFGAQINIYANPAIEFLYNKFHPNKGKKKV